MSDEDQPQGPHYDRDRALAEALDVAVGRGAGEVDVTTPTPGVGEGITGGELVTRIAVPDWAARSWQICLSPPMQLGIPFPTNASLQSVTWYSTTPQRIPDLRYPEIPLIARIVWGQGGASFQADVSWINGSSFVVHGSYVEVRAVLLSPWGSGVPTIATVKVRAAITPAESNGRRTAPPMLASAPAVIPASVTTDFLIPPFAKSIRLVRHAGPNNYPTLEVSQFSDVARVNNVFFEIVTASTANMSAARAAERMFPVAANGKIFSIRNMDVNANTFHLEYELDLG